jgi:hypothetical protein
VDNHSLEEEEVAKILVDTSSVGGDHMNFVNSSDVDNLLISITTDTEAL